MTAKSDEFKSKFQVLKQISAPSRERLAGCLSIRHRWTFIVVHAKGRPSHPGTIRYWLLILTYFRESTLFTKSFDGFGDVGKSSVGVLKYFPTVQISFPGRAISDLKPTDLRLAPAHFKKRGPQWSSSHLRHRALKSKKPGCLPAIATLGFAELKNLIQHLLLHVFEAQVMSSIQQSIQLGRSFLPSGRALVKLKPTASRLSAKRVTFP